MGKLADEMKAKANEKKAKKAAENATFLEQLNAAKSVKDLQAALVKYFGGE